MITPIKPTIRRYELQDIDDLFLLYSEPAVIKNTSQAPHLNKQQVAALFAPENYHTLVATLEGRVVGNVTLILSTKPREKHCASVAIAVHPDTHRQGVGHALLQEAISQADHWLNLRRLELDVLCSNHAAISLYEKMGFQPEGRKRQATFHDGEFVDLLFMSRLKPYS